MQRTQPPIDALVGLARAFSVAFAASALFHASAALVPSLAPAAPAWRHLLFVALNLLSSVGFLRRPRWFTWAFGVLVVQQLISHGSDAWTQWFDHRRVDVVSLAVVAFMPLAWCVLFALGRSGPRPVR